MVIERSDGMRREELDSLQLNMLLANTPTNLIPLRLQEVNEEAILLYNISSLKMLSYSLRGGAFTEQDAFELLSGIVQALEQAANYMLHVERFVLHEQFIFIGNGWRDASLIYLPMHVPQAPALRVQMKQLLAVMLQHLAGERTNRLSELARQCDQENWSLSLFKQQLQQFASGMNETHSQPRTGSQIISKMQQEIQPHSQLQQQSQSQNGGNNTFPQYQQTPSPKSEVSSSAGKLKSPVQSKTSTTPDQPKKEKPAWGLGTQVNKSQKKQTEDEATSNKNLLVIGLVASLLGCAFAWSQYITLMTESWMYIALGLTLVLAAFLLVYLPRGLKDWSISRNKKMNKPKFVLEDEGSEYDVAIPEIAAAVVKPVSNIRDSAHTSLADPPVSGAQTTAQSTFQPTVPSSTQYEKKQLDYYSDLPQHTTLLSREDSQATVYLGKNALGKAEVSLPIDQAVPKPFLETVRQGTTIQIPIHGDPFIIGRGNEAHVKTESSIGVSRMHAEITQKDGNYIIRDLGSKNGTSLNQTQLVAYESYPLAEGDCIEVLTNTYLFKKTIL